MASEDGGDGCVILLVMALALFAGVRGCSRSGTALEETDDLGRKVRNVDSETDKLKRHDGDRQEEIEALKRRVGQLEEQATRRK